MDVLPRSTRPAHKSGRMLVTPAFTPVNVLAVTLSRRQRALTTAAGEFRDENGQVVTTTEC